MTVLEAFNQTSVVINQTYINSSGNGIPISIWICLLVICAAFTLASFAFKLRNDRGEVSSERIVFSLISIIFWAFTAWLSLSIDVIAGVAASSGSEDTSVIGYVAIHSIYNIPEISILCVIISLIMFASIIYSIISKDIVIPDKKDYGTKPVGEEK